MSTAPLLYTQLKLLGALAQKRAFTPAYRALAIGPTHVRAAGLFGQMSCEANLGFDREFMVDADDFLQTLRSLPDAEFEAELTDGALRWSCGPAKGHLALMPGLNVPTPIFETVPGEPVGTAFADGLELGSLSCSHASEVRTLNLLGVQIVSRDGRVTACASDNSCLSSCDLEATLAPGIVTLLPDAVYLLAALIRRDGQALISHDANSLFCATASTRLLLNQIPPLRTDLSLVVDRYQTTEIVLPLFRGGVAAFLRRAEALSDTAATVEVSVEAGRMGLAFRQSTASSEEYFIVEDGPEVSIPPVHIEARRLAKALTRADRLVFDYAQDHVEHKAVILRGPQQFLYAITGRRD